MDRIRKNFGFGCMRLPTRNEEIDYEEFTKMVDAFLAAGFNYFDTARPYHGGKSEAALRACLTSRYPRDRYVLTNKLSGSFFNSGEDIRPLFQKQLELCGVDYFDFYLMHAQSAKSFPKFKQCRAYETALELKAEGKFRHLGISFHDKPDYLEGILTEYPQIEVVMLQFNYADYENPAVESRRCYEVCRKFGKPVMVMEPVKGGTLAKLPEDAQKLLDDLGGGSPASYAIRFAASFEGVVMVLSGMSDLAMLEDNLSFMSHFKPLDARELAAVAKVSDTFQARGLIPCTDCRYCVPHCPQSIPIPDLFSRANTRRAFQTWNAPSPAGAPAGRNASDCIRCGACEDICPQHLSVRQLLADIG